MNFDFIGKRKFAYALSIIVIIAGIVSLFVQGLNFGVDFTGGTVYQIQFEDEKDIADLTDLIAKPARIRKEIIRQLEG